MRLATVPAYGTSQRHKRNKKHYKKTTCKNNPDDPGGMTTVLKQLHVILGVVAPTTKNRDVGRHLDAPHRNVGGWTHLDTLVVRLDDRVTIAVQVRNTPILITYFFLALTVAVWSLWRGGGQVDTPCHHSRQHPEEDEAEMHAFHCLRSRLEKKCSRSA